MRKAVIALIVLALVGGVGYIVWINMNDTEDSQTVEDTSTSESTENDTADQSTQEAAATDAVSYTNEGFSPATITVKVGTKVTWTNESDSDMWVGSDPHPVHTDYSAFDQKSTGDTYSFTFDEAGTYEYHNHQNSSDTGTVIVEE